MSIAHSVKPQKIDIDASMKEIREMSPAQAQLIIQKLKMERNILRTLASCLLSLCFKSLSDEKKRSLTHLVKIQAEMAKLEVPGDE